MGIPSGFKGEKTGLKSKPASGTEAQPPEKPTPDRSIFERLSGIPPIALMQSLKEDPLEIPTNRWAATGSWAGSSGLGF
jgi:hypothetical protein